MGDTDLKALNYFTCTLGESAEWKGQQPKGAKTAYHTVLQLVDNKAQETPDDPAIGFADFTAHQHDDGLPFLTFGALNSRSRDAARILSRELHGAIKNESPAMIGLLCSSSLDFVLTWLGLMRLGHTALLLAPQLEAPAIKHLCEGEAAMTILIDKTHEKWTTQPIEGITFQHIPDYQCADAKATISPNQHVPKSSDVAYLRHTSGTSSGLPKPIVQTHWGAVGVLPRLTGHEHSATFTTTPLYHGGLADCFRAWTGGAMIWFFPEGKVPVTETNVRKAIEFSRKNSPSSVCVEYFTSVPYVLQGLASDREGLRLLQGMSLVGVGGAALAATVGDELVRQGVKLVSRMGSAECGFLMSSHRDYDSDKEWQYLRPVTNDEFISFEPRDGGLFELVAKPGWPLRTKQNRQDGSYATSDLFQPHDAISNAWRYHSRSDAQITLANGKKFDPAPLEGDILGGADLLEDIFVFGTGREFPGALLFPRSENLSKAKVIEGVWPSIERINSASQSHSRLTKTALVVVSKKGGQENLEKSSKGTVMRRQAEEKYAELIESVYGAGKDQHFHHETLNTAQLQEMIVGKFSQIIDRVIDPDDDIFRQGVDSIACIQIRKLVETSLVPPGSCPLPLNVIYEQQTVRNLALYIQTVRQGNEKGNCLENTAIESSEMKQMATLTKVYRDFDPATVSQVKSREGNRRGIILTGATGALGAHLLHCLRESPEMRKIYCLVRAQTANAAHERVSQSLRARGLCELEQFASHPSLEQKVVCLPCDIFNAHLGLSEEMRGRISQDCSIFVHAAWTVNFSLRLGSFEDHIRGLHHMIRFAISIGSNLVFVSSTASVSRSSEQRILESIPSNPSDAAPLGYSRSKWVAEQVCSAANHHCVSKAAEEDFVHGHPQVSVVRVGQLCGNAAGVWNASEAYPLMLSTAKITGCLPDLQDESLNWLPVDQAAQALLEIIIHDTDGRRRTAPEPGGASPVYHVLNPHRQPAWRDMLEWVQDDKGSRSTSFEIVSPREWISRLEKALDVGGGDGHLHPAQKLVGFWQQKYRDEPIVNGTTHKPRVFDTKNSCRVSKTMAQVHPLSQAQVLKMWDWICSHVA
ncbi:hypothetical protein PFICI_12763 [Pestalotiopsis fici W106-1]|uniref:Carrier domain-containing protein n=1 Tax=Pestalotiopsis fici (strain W106-1 / CGMCC3.15140) TaxID=1229662 RepID=W3WPV2_PESFW|nr:uncharacterized protein PFICI_12763 [Pestalotiopsis fici W106-1]ETS75819.1 hypothetical protein PFICI_12763 [Pestalotiopsis fici W106-1]